MSGKLRDPRPETYGLDNPRVRADAERIEAPGLVDPPSLTGQQLVARIKRSSKYWGQTKPNQWFDVRVAADTWYQLRGNNNNYRFSDVALGVRLDSNTIVDFTNGRTIQL